MLCHGAAWIYGQMTDQFIFFAVALMTLLAVIVTAGIQWWLRRRAARRTLDALTSAMGLRRLSKETDEELRARARSIVLSPQRGTKEDIRILVRDALWGRGYRRIDVVVFSEPAFGIIRAQARAPVPAGVLRVIERELADKLPATMALELSAES